MGKQKNKTGDKMRTEMRSDKFGSSLNKWIYDGQIAEICDANIDSLISHFYASGDDAHRLYIDMDKVNVYKYIVIDGGQWFDRVRVLNSLIFNYFDYNLVDNPKVYRLQWDAGLEDDAKLQALSCNMLCLEEVRNSKMLNVNEILELREKMVSIGPTIVTIADKLIGENVGDIISTISVAENSKVLRFNLK